LIHVSQLANRFVQDAHEVVKTGQIVKVKVLEVDLARKRIGLTMRLDAQPAPRGAENRHEPANRASRGSGRAREDSRAAPTAMAAAFARLGR
ncbi:MAG: S1 RNA-binding domain-containing protein, partial [Burkholderiaceae bacterium]|nr:S1 RNA-binding domain-containing protein [Burkholderiaceae bacterium]